MFGLDSRGGRLLSTVVCQSMASRISEYRVYVQIPCTLGVVHGYYLMRIDHVEWNIRLRPHYLGE